MFLTGGQLTSTLWFRNPGSLHLVALYLPAVTLDCDACLHQAGRGKCCSVQMQEDCMVQTWKWCVLLPLTFLWLELSHEVVFNHKWSLEWTGSGGQQASCCYGVCVCSSTSAWFDFALGMKTGQLWVGNISFGCSEAIFVHPWFLLCNRKRRLFNRRVSDYCRNISLLNL